MLSHLGAGGASGRPWVVSRDPKSLFVGTCCMSAGA